MLKLLFSLALSTTLMLSPLSAFAQANLNNTHYVASLGQEVTRWNDQNKVVYVFISQAPDLPYWKPEHVGLAKKAFAEWQQALENRFTFQFVDSSDQADINVSWTVKPDVMHDKMRVGQNQLIVWQDYIWKSDVKMSLTNNLGQAFPNTNLYHAILHEIGHVLGITGHSPYPEDIMYPQAAGVFTQSFPHLSPKDIRTIKTLYTLKPTYTNPTGIRIAQFKQFVSEVQLGDQASDNEDFHTAYAHYQKARSIYPLDAENEYDMGKCAYYLDHLEEAVARLEPLLQNTSERIRINAQELLAYTLIDVANRHENNGNVTAARDTFSRALSLMLPLQKMPHLDPDTKANLQSSIAETQQRLQALH